MLPPDKRLKISLKLAHSPTPFFGLLPYVGRELRMKKNSSDHLITVEIEVEEMEASRRNRDGNTVIN